jgi:hypothetical protein
VPIMARSPGFEFRQMKYWENTARSLVTMEKQQNSGDIHLFFYFLIVVSSCHREGSSSHLRSSNIFNVGITDCRKLKDTIFFKPKIHENTFSGYRVIT